MTKKLKFRHKLLVHALTGGYSDSKTPPFRKI